ncbi:MAG TPA: PAS domain-containing sensor histidine kinase [Burkholderiales bacterium]|jgi:PAS domain S-box
MGSDNSRTGVNVEKLLRLLAEQTREQAVILIDTQGHILWWGRGAEHVFGYRPEAIVGEPIARLFTPEDVLRGMPDYELETARRDGMAEDDIWMMRADGSRLWAAGAVTPIRDETGEIIAYGKILRDRTDQKEQLDTLRNQAQALKRADEHKDIFLSTLSHELRNPLAPLVNALQLIRMISPDAPALQYPVKLIERQVQFIRRLVDDLLDVTRISSGKVQLRSEPLDLRDVVTCAVESVRPASEERQHALTVSLLPAPILVHGDRDRLQQVFINLFTNAVKYTPEGGQIQIKGLIEGDEAVVKVQDSGIGIAEDMQPRIFELFTQAEDALSRAQGGLGIGLSLVKQLVSLHQGSVQVRSGGTGKGSEFTVRLPLRA